MNRLLNAWRNAKGWVLGHKAMSVTFLLAFVLDRISKEWALADLQTRAIELFPYFHLRYVENTGAAFGIMENGNLFLILVTSLVCAYLIKSWKELSAQGPLAEWGLTLILAGAIGNLYDRIALGFVVDFLDFRVWPVFNGADSFITVGGCLLALSLFFGRKHAEGK